MIAAVIINPRLPVAAQVPAGWRLQVTHDRRAVAVPHPMPGLTCIALAWNRKQVAA